MYAVTRSMSANHDLSGAECIYRYVDMYIYMKKEIWIWSSGTQQGYIYIDNLQFTAVRNMFSYYREITI